MENTAKWKTYEFQVLQKDASWNAVGGVYIFAGIKDNFWRAYYIGQAESFKTRMLNHDKWDEARELGATHVHAMTIQQAASRDAIERDLIQSFQPQLNVQHR
jgi:excinuclease UvrABC nuclease subunit